MLHEALHDVIAKAIAAEVGDDADQIRGHQAFLRKVGGLVDADEGDAALLRGREIKNVAGDDVDEAGEELGAGAVVGLEEGLGDAARLLGEGADVQEEGLVERVDERDERGLVLRGRGFGVDGAVLVLDNGRGRANLLPERADNVAAVLVEGNVLNRSANGGEKILRDGHLILKMEEPLQHELALLRARIVDEGTHKRGDGVGGGARGNLARIVGLHGDLAGLDGVVGNDHILEGHRGGGVEGRRGGSAIVVRVVVVSRSVVVAGGGGAVVSVVGAAGRAASAGGVHGIVVVVRGAGVGHHVLLLLLLHSHHHLLLLLHAHHHHHLLLVLELLLLGMVVVVVHGHGGGVVGGIGHVRVKAGRGVLGGEEGRGISGGRSVDGHVSGGHGCKSRIEEEEKEGCLFCVSGVEKSWRKEEKK